MASKKQPEPEVPLCETWVCEGCKGCHTGVNPPDACHCGHEYFVNMQDVEDGREPGFRRH